MIVISFLLTITGAVSNADINCAIACVYALVKEHDSQVRLSEVVEAFPVRYRGLGKLTPVAEVVTAFEKLGLKARAVRFDSGAQIRGSALFLVATDESHVGHFVLIREEFASRDGLEVFDPLLLQRTQIGCEEIFSMGPGIGVIVEETYSIRSVVLAILQGVLGFSAVIILDPLIGNCDS